MSQPPQGVKISGYIFYALAAINLLFFCMIVAALGLLISSGEVDEQVAIFGIGLCFTLLFSILYVAIGYGLMQLQSWARIAAIIVAILSLCSFPFGTIGGGVVLYFMFQDDVTQSFS